MMKLLQPISFRRIFLTILSAVIGGFVGISIWYFGFTPMGRDHFIQIQNYKEQEQYRKNDYDEYFQLPLLSGFDWNTIGTGKQEFTLTMSEYNSYFKNGTGEKITNYGNRVKIPMQTMMNSSQSGFIIKIIDPEPDQRVFFNIYRIMDKYYSGGILSPLRYYVSFLTQIPFVSKSDFVIINVAFGGIGGEEREENHTCVQFVNNNVYWGRISTENLENNCLLVWYDDYGMGRGFEQYIYKYYDEYLAFMEFSVTTKSPESVVLSIKKMK